MIIEDEDYAGLSRAAHEWRDRIHGEGATDADREAFKLWLMQDIRHEEAYDRAVTFWAAYDHLQAEDIDRDLMPPPESARHSILPDKTKALFRRVPFRIAATAFILAAIAAPSTLFLSPRNDPAPIISQPALASYSTDIAETRIVTLDDGTIATLGALTEIEVSISAQGRSIRLRGGAALFDVEPDPSRPFSVLAGELTATALGTEFDVRNNGGVFRVAVAEGRVEVVYPSVADGAQSAAQTRRTLSAGQEVSATAETGLRDIHDVSADAVGEWRHEKLVYDGATLAELVADANRYDERDIILTENAQELAQQTITASFDATRTDRMLRMVAMSYPVEIDTSDPGVVRVSARHDASE